MKLVVNNREFAIDADPAMPLLWALRDIIGLTGTKFGCGAAQCGACTVHLDGQAIRSCITPVSDAEGKSSRRSKPPPMAPTASVPPCTRHGSSTMWRSAATARVARS